MLGPASLRSHQQKSSLKTYGSRGKRPASFSTNSTSASDATTSTQPSARQYDWDRLEKQRKVRIEQARAQAQARAQERREQATSSNVNDYDAVDVDPDTDALLYSDKETEDDGNQNVTMTGSEFVPSSQGSDVFESSQSTLRRPLSKPQPMSRWAKRSLDTSSVSTIPSSQNSDSESGIEMPRWGGGRHSSWTATALTEQPTGQDIVAPSNRLIRASSPLLAEAPAPGYHSKTMQEKDRLFSEHAYEDDDPDNEDADNGADEVLFRSPSFGLLMKLREIPKPQFPEPRLNPFGYGSLSTGAGESSKEAEKNPFLVTESPKTKKTIDIFQRRRQQLLELQNRSKPVERRGIGSQKKDMAMEVIEGENGTADNSSIDQRHDTSAVSSRNRGNSWQETVSMESSDHRSTPQQNPFQHTTPERKGTTDLAGPDDNVDWALGKRMSSIEITPRRLLAKQRKTSSHDPLSPTRSPASRMLTTKRADKTLDDLTLGPLQLYLDRDIPQHDKNSHDNLFQPAQRSTTSFSGSSSISSTSHPSIPGYRAAAHTVQVTVDKNRGASAQRRPKASADSKQRARPSILKRPATAPPAQRQSTGSQGDAAVVRDAPSSSYQRSTQMGLSMPNSQSQLQPHLLMQSEQEQQLTSDNAPQPQQPLGDQIHRPRPIRSLRRPPAALVSSRKTEIKPTLEELLLICDQRFFEQFRDLDRDESSQNEVPDDKPREILDFEYLLPECMRDTLAKIGEASYSEVYTVDLPVQQRRLRQHGQRRKNQQERLDEEEFALFQSQRLNAYIKESAEDDLAPQSMAGTISTKLVMKIMPFCDVEENSSSGAAGDHARRRKARSKAAQESTLLALEDIYREATVSTQIMHGWKGFIGSFGALVVRGKYPKSFLAAWDRFRKDKGTESYRPDYYTKNQLYCIILLPYGGIDLEHCPLANWRQAWSSLAQVAASLESKEQAPYRFEHRDLHWGNILVKGTCQENIIFARRDGIDQRKHDSRKDDRDKYRRIPTFGIVVQMIDFTLARVQGDRGSLIYMDMEKDQDLFQGQGDYQFEIYRKMRKLIGKDWAASCPHTNVFWLHYVADKLLTEKDLEAPKSLSKSSTKAKALSLRRPSTKLSSFTSGFHKDDEEKMEEWCYERVLAVAKMSLDRLDPADLSPSGTALDLLLFDGP
ncbi:hypothetical protein BGZ51_009128 [Haplosporangium sp. Z 767]|nr:hypothetical protein BGZ51_009128 [Haplosporangium sp. Z 767]KAF9197070.1 hypothetical protein BGZ50_000020 [Haplosporangium sp. Z 11]